MRDLHLDLDPSLGRRAGLEEALREAIRRGHLADGDLLPSSRSLASDLGIARATVVLAYEQLAVEGYVASRQGYGTTVSVGHAEAEPIEVGAPDARALSFDFRPGEPDGSAFPRAAWLRSVRRAVSDSPDEGFGYGDASGHQDLRVALTAYLGRSRAVAARPDAISIFGGVTAAIGFVAEALARRGIDRIAVEDPSLFYVRQVLTLAGATPVPVPVDDAGLCVDRLDQSGVRAVITTPGHQYPMGMTMSPRRRSELVDWARSNDAWIVEDDYDGEFRYDRSGIGALQGLDPDRVIYAGTASKSLAPALRLAWLAVPPDLRADLVRVKHVRGGVSAIDQMALADFIARGEFDRHVRAVRNRYRLRHDDLCARLADIDWLDVPDHQAGLHVTCTIGNDLEESAIEQAAARHSVHVMGLGPHWMTTPTQRGLVVGYSRPAQHQFAEATDRLIGALKTL